MAWFAIPLGYLLGCIPTAYAAGHLLGRGDIRLLGDGNPGARNTFRQLGARVGLAVFCIDAGKGALAVLAAQALHAPPLVVFATGVAVVAGHNWPVFLGFRGGEGTAATIGVFTVLMPKAVLLLAAPTVLTLVLTRSTDIACAVLFIPLAPLCLWCHYSVATAIYGMVLPCIISSTHFLRLFARRHRALRPA